MILVAGACLFGCSSDGSSTPDASSDAGSDHGGVPLGGTIVTDTVISQTGNDQTDVPVTFGQIFAPGDVPEGEGLAATLNGAPVNLQVDVKTTHADGSLRHAVLTAWIPSLPGSASGPLAITAASASMSGAPVSLTQLLATAYDATASLSLGGTTYTVAARPLLQAAATASACKPWSTQCNTWLSGPLASEWVVHGPVKTAGGTADPSLEVYFDVRAYAGNSAGTVGLIRTDIIVENAWAFGPQAQPQYTATLASGSATYTSPALTQYAATRWHRVLWWNGAEPLAYLRQDTQYLQNSRAISRYMPIQPDEAFLATLRQTCDPLDYCDQTQTMGNTGAQPSIGPLPRWTSVYVLDPDIRAYHWMLANDDALGAYGVHYRDQGTGWPLSIQTHPNVTIADWAYASGVAAGTSNLAADYKKDLLPNCVNDAVVTSCTTSWYGTGNPDVWDNAHQPSDSYVSYIVTGSYYYMSEIAFGASLNEIYPNEAYRGNSKGLIAPSHGQVRGKAWVLREMANAAYILPDVYPLKSEFNADVNNSIADFDATYANNSGADPLRLMNDGLAYSMNGGTNNGIAPWQHNFLTWSAGHAAELGFAGAGAFRDWLAGFEIGLMTDWQNDPTKGYCWLEASTYNVQVKDNTGSWLPSYTAVYAATFPTLVGLACNSGGSLEGTDRRGHLSARRARASCARGRASRMRVFSLEGHTRFVRSATTTRASGSIQTLVPVKPR